MKRSMFALLATVLSLTAIHRCCASYVLDLDAAAFRANDSLGYVEVYAGIQRSGLTYVHTGDSLTASFSVLLEVLKDNQVAMTDTFFAKDVVDTSEAHSNVAGQYFTHSFRFIMLPDTYGLRVSLFQSGLEPLDVLKDTLLVRTFGMDSLRLSDVELGSRLDFVKEKSPFVKNGVLLIPNPTGFFGTKLPLFYYYLEAYGLDFDSAKTDSFVVFQRIRDAETHKLVRPEGSKSHRTMGTTAVIADGFPVTTLRTGTYILELEVKSQRSGRTALIQKKFWTFRKEDVAAGQAFKPQPTYAERVSSMAPGFLEVVDPDSAILWMKYILTRDESNQVKRLTADGKREFLAGYWKPRDAEKPGTSNQYFARVVEANRRYTFLRRPGWKTDRGRVFILYGEPDRVVRGDVAAASVDQEVWEYDQLKGGVIFVFADVRGYGDYDIVHSTMPGELYNPNWNQMGTNARPRSDQLMH